MFAAIILPVLFATSACFGFVVEPNTYSSGRIVGGEDAAEGQFPWAISLRTREDNQHQCGGSILNSRWILTAAHCLYFTTSPDDNFVVVGSRYLNGGTVYNISRYIVHEDFDLVTIMNDVAVIELAQELEFNALIQPLELNTEFVDEVDSVVSGWGRLYVDGPLPDILQFINVRTITNEECREFPPPYPEIYVSDDEICTLTRDSILSTCSGDSGGALVADDKQIGIVSWGNLPCGAGQPEMYARISSFAEWINNAINS